MLAKHATYMLLVYRYMQNQVMNSFTLTRNNQRMVMRPSNQHIYLYKEIILVDYDMQFINSYIYIHNYAYIEKPTKSFSTVEYSEKYQEYIII